MTGDNLAIQGGQKLHVGDIQVGVTDRLDHDAGGDAGGTQAAETLRQIDADQTERTHLADQVAVDFSCLLALHVARRDLLRGETTRTLLEGALLFGKDHWYFRKSGLRFSLNALTPS